LTEINIIIYSSYTQRDGPLQLQSNAKEVQVAANQGNMKSMFSSIRRLTNSAKPATGLPIRDKEGKTITSIDGPIRRWIELLEESLNISTSLTKREEPVIV
jgi:hypothetical protein